MEKEYDLKQAAGLMDLVFKNSSDDKFTSFLTIIKKLFNNIINKPHEDKFRTVKNNLTIFKFQDKKNKQKIARKFIY